VSVNEKKEKSNFQQQTHRSTQLKSKKKKKKKKKKAYSIMPSGTLFLCRCLCKHMMNQDVQPDGTRRYPPNVEPIGTDGGGENTSTTTLFSFEYLPKHGSMAISGMILSIFFGGLLLGIGAAKSDFGMIGGGGAILVVGLAISACLGAHNKGTKMLIDFKNRQITYSLYAVPHFFCCSPSKTLPIDRLSEIEVYDTGSSAVQGTSSYALSNANEGFKVFLLRIRGNEQGEFLTIGKMEGMHEVTPVTNCWKTFLAQRGIFVKTTGFAGSTENANALQLRAISAPAPTSIGSSVSNNTYYNTKSPSSSINSSNSTAGTSSQYKQQQQSSSTSYVPARPSSSSKTPKGMGFYQGHSEIDI